MQHIIKYCECVVQSKCEIHNWILFKKVTYKFALKKVELIIKLNKIKILY